ncbi:MAG: Eco47II family restriction endonuclease [Candidatus Moraniibacteriota bacterium]
MIEKNLLPFISNEDLYEQVKRVLSVAEAATSEAEEKLHKNVIDPFSALFDASYQGVSFEQWLKQEQSRQIQKTFQNAIGTFHQSILGAMPGWKDLKTGSIVDIVNSERKIIAEIKNKYNTTKGNHKSAIYTNLHKLINKEYSGCTAYYVEIIPKGGKMYDKSFTPSDNNLHSQKRADSHIRIIDGRSFYALASGYPDAIEQLYTALPQVIQDILQKPDSSLLKKEELAELFSKAYSR